MITAARKCTACDGTGVCPCLRKARKTSPTLYLSGLLFDCQKHKDSYCTRCHGTGREPARVTLGDNPVLQAIAEKLRQR